MINKIYRKIRKMLRPTLGMQSPIVQPSVVVSSWEQYKDYIRIHPTAIIAPSASIKIFNPPNPPRVCLEIGEGSHIFSAFSLLRPEAKITIGKRCQLGSSQFICADSIAVGDDVLMAWGVTLMDTDSHALAWEYRKNDATQAYEDYCTDKSNFIKNKDWSHVLTRPIILKDRTWIGFNAAILKGVTVGNNAVVGACSVVVKDAPPYTVVCGNPANVVKYLQK